MNCRAISGTIKCHVCNEMPKMRRFLLNISSMRTEMNWKENKRNLVMLLQLLMTLTLRPRPGLLDLESHAIVK